MLKTCCGAEVPQSFLKKSQDAATQRYRVFRLLLAAAILSAAGCAGLPRHVAKSHTVALQDPASTTLGSIVASDEPGRNLSGIRLLSSGEEALASLIAL